MLSDRSYMRDDYPREKTSVLVWLVCAIVAGFAIQVGFNALWPNGGGSLIKELGLTVNNIRAWHFWTIVTSSFLHDTQILFHPAVNLLGLYFIGRELLPVLGSRRFLGLYFGAIAVGGLTWLAVHWRLGGTYYGATAGVDALLIVFACFYPHRRLDFLLFFIFPVAIKPKQVAIALVFFEIFGLLIYEVRNTALPFDFALASSAHLGGMLAGWFYFRYFHDVPWHFPSEGVERELPRWMKRGTKNIPAAPAAQIDMSNPSDVRAEVDRILDKINSHGFNALTGDEKRLLDEAKALLSRR